MAATAPPPIRGRTHPIRRDRVVVRALPAPHVGGVFIDRLAERYGLGDSGRLLDLGCGTGRLTLSLARASPKRST
jgi:2-polyprenyl-3-methyl-5-hydroxy-6-metoxy-1,4-benzoquinol methylase